MFLEGREYYLISVLIILAAVFIFLLSFEKRKPQTREVVVLSVMIALAVIGRIMFFMTPQIKPCGAIIIITGIMLGKEAGFLSGAITAFVSNFFFGQGPWTPWQIIAFGIMGLMSAIIFSGRWSGLADNRPVLCIYGFLITFVVYGLIMDTATVLMYTDKPSMSALLATYMTGAVFNGIHGISAALFLWFLSAPLFTKLKRIKKKYGIYS